MAVAVQLARVSRRYGSSFVLRDIHLNLPEAETLVLFGENGAGKTTLLKILAGSLSPYSGEGRIFGYDLQDKRSVREHAVFLSSESGLYADLTVSENLTFMAQMLGQSIDVMALLSRVGVQDAAHKRARMLSSGMKKRVSLCKMLFAPQPLVLLDEPFAHLDVSGKELVLDMLSQARDQGKTIMFSSHEPEYALKAATLQHTIQGGILL